MGRDMAFLKNNLDTISRNAVLVVMEAGTTEAHRGTFWEVNFLKLSALSGVFPQHEVNWHCALLHKLLSV